MGVSSRGSGHSLVGVVSLGAWPAPGSSARYPRSVSDRGERTGHDDGHFEANHGYTFYFFQNIENAKFEEEC